MLGDDGSRGGNRRDRRIEHGAAMVAVAAHTARGLARRGVVPLVALNSLGGGHGRLDVGGGGAVVAKAGGHARRGRDDEQRQDAGGHKPTQVPPPCHRSTHGRSIASGSWQENALHDYTGELGHLSLTGVADVRISERSQCQQLAQYETIETRREPLDQVTVVDSSAAIGILTLKVLPLSRPALSTPIVPP